jgi:iron complex transport system permease protein
MRHFGTLAGARIFVLAILCFVALVVNISFGAVPLSWENILPIFFLPRELQSELVLSQKFILSMRATHALTALFVGAALALVGSVLQRLLRNPLGDPFVLGITSGGTFAAVWAIVAGLPFFFWGVPVRMLAALAGSLCALFLLLLVRRFIFSDNATYAVPIAGMMLNALFSAALMLVIVFADSTRLGEAQRWLMGDIQLVSLFELLALGALTALLGAILIRLSPAVSALSFGEEFATSIGFHAQFYGKLVFLLCAILTAIVVSVAGSVGFVGLIVPHMARAWMRTNAAAEWLASAILGATLVLVADTLARTVAAPSELPVGVFTALIGVPTLVVLAVRSRGRYAD